MGYWVDTTDPYRTMDPAYVESVWWALKQIHSRGLLVAGLPRRAVLPAGRHGAVRPRGRAGLRDRHRPERLRPLPADLRTRSRARPPCWCGRRRRGRWCPTPRSRRGPTSPTSWPPTAPRRWSSRSRCSTRCSARAGPSSSGSPAPRWSAGPTSGRSRWWSSRPARPHRTSSCWPTTSPPRTAPAWCTSPPPSARTTWRSAAPTACRSSCRSAPTAASGRTCRWSAASSSSTPTPTWSPTSSPAGCCSGTWRTSTATRTAGAATRR